MELAPGNLPYDSENVTEVTFPQTNYFAASLLDVTNIVVLMLGRLTLYIMRFCSLSLKERKYRYFFGGWEEHGRKENRIWLMYMPTVTSRQTCLVLWQPIKKLTALVMTELSGSFQKLHQQHKTHRQKCPGVEYHGVAIFFSILSNMTSLLNSEHLLFFLWNKNNKNL